MSPRFIRITLIAMLAFSLALAGQSAAIGQLPFPSQPQETQNQSNSWWDLNRPRVCGKLRCMDVYFPYFPYKRGMGNNITIATLPDLENPEAANSEIENRATSIEETLLAIFKKTAAASKSVTAGPSNVLTDNPFLNPRDWWLRADKPLHPSTPKVEVGIENEQTVIFVPDQPELGLTSQTIMTVNEADELHNGKPIPELASQWRDGIRQDLSSALWGQEFDRRFPWARSAIVAILAAAIAALLIAMSLLRKVFRVWERRISGRLRQIEETATARSREIAEAAASFNDPLAVGAGSAGKGEAEGVTSQDSQPRSAWPSSWLSEVSTLARKVRSLVSPKLRGSIPDFNFPLRTQTLLKQLANLMQLLLRLLFWMRFFLLFVGLSLMAMVLPQTRIYSLYFLGQAIFLPLIWMSVVLGDTLTSFLIDYYLDRWAQEAQLANPNSHRYVLRVSTYSPAIKGASFLCFVILGIYLSVQFLGVDTNLLASAGAVALLVGFLSRNLFENMLNGALILWTDRYAVGDVIQVGNVSGFVENMTLYTTQLRGSEGRLITIPNGQIGTVENLTKDWSRVDFTVEIARDADVRQAMETIQQVAEQMQAEPHWRDLILEPASILGVDRVSHAGTLIQVWIKTQPLQQWSVGREFRLRVKQAFDRAGIPLGVPQQEILYRNGVPKMPPAT